MASAQDYIDLLPAQHTDKPDFKSVLTATLQPFADSLNVMNSLEQKLDVDTASGDQLNILGEWVGIPRRLSVPITNVYFAFDTPGLGFDQGVWFSPGQPAEGVAILDDGTYRLMIQAKIAANTWDGSLGDANQKLIDIFPGADVFLKDNFNMSESFIISGTPPSVLFQQLVIQGYIELKPAAVALA